MGSEVAGHIFVADKSVYVNLADGLPHEARS